MRVSKYPCVYMRGGTSKAVFFHERDLPADHTAWNALFLRVMGSPDVKQIDGMGGAMQITSKIAVIAPSDEPGVDISYTYCQVDIAIPNVDGRSNCGNISSAVGPFAIDEGLVQVVEPVTVVRIRNTNTGKLIEAHVEVENGRAKVFGSTAIPGVPGTGSPIGLHFLAPGGAVTGRLFPTGQRREWISIADEKPVEVSIVDCSNPVVFVRAADLGLSGTELSELNGMTAVMERIACIREEAAFRCGLVSTPAAARTESTSVPKVGLISPPQTYRSIDGTTIEVDDMDLCVRAVTAGMLHRAYPMTVAVATGAAARLEGTIVQEIAGLPGGSGPVRLGHAGGSMEVQMRLDGDTVVSGGVVRTARRILDGWVYVREE